MVTMRIIIFEVMMEILILQRIIIAYSRKKS